nr:hypothetical protein [Tanacetum cinerariifolium]
MFEVKGQLLRELRKISILGGPTDSAIEHISNVLEMASVFNAQESTLIQVFHLTAKGIAKRWPMLATAHAKIDVYDKKISLGVGHNQAVFNINKKESPASISPIFVINKFDEMQEFESAKTKEDFGMTLCDPDKRISIGLEDFVDIEDMWDDLDPGIQQLGGNYQDWIDS